MSNDHSSISAHQLPATFRKKIPWIMWGCVALATVTSLVFLSVAARGARAGWTASDSVFFLDFIALVCVSFILLAFTLLFTFAHLKGVPVLHVDRGIVRMTPLLGQARVLHLSDYAAVSLGEAKPSQGYHPQLEVVPHTPGEKKQILSLGPYVSTRAEAEVLIALIRHAAGEPYAPPPAKSEAQKQVERNEWRRLAIFTGGFVAMLILLNWPR